LLIQTTLFPCFLGSKSMANANPEPTTVKLLCEKYFRFDACASLAACKATKKEKKAVWEVSSLDASCLVKTPTADNPAKVCGHCYHLRSGMRSLGAMQAHLNSTHSLQPAEPEENVQSILRVKSEAEQLVAQSALIRWMVCHLRSYDCVTDPIWHNLQSAYYGTKITSAAQYKQLVISLHTLTMETVYSVLRTHYVSLCLDIGTNHNLHTINFVVLCEARAFVVAVKELKDSSALAIRLVVDDVTQKLMSENIKVVSYVADNRMLQ